MASNTKKSKEPSGLKITRNKNLFICEWKQPSSGYGDGQKFAWDTKKVGEKHLVYSMHSIGKKLTYIKEEVDTSKWYPNKKKYLSLVGFSVQGNRDVDPEKKDKYVWSSPVSETKTIKKPKKPTSVSHVRNSAYNFTFGAVAGNYSDSSSYWATHIEFKTCLRKGMTSYPEYDPTKVPTSAWDTPSASPKKISSSNNSIVWVCDDTSESSFITNATSMVRWFKARTAGPRGYSTWVSDYFVYAYPMKPEVVNDSIDDLSKDTPKGNPITARSPVVVKKTADSCNCTVVLNVCDMFARPTDYIELQYAIAEPDADGNPVNPNWQQAPLGGENNYFIPEKEKITSTGKVKIVDDEEETEWTTYKKYQKEDKKYEYYPISFPLPASPNENQFVYFKAIAHHENWFSESDTVIGVSLQGKIHNRYSVLPTPTIKTITPVQNSENQIDVVTTNASSITSTSKNTAYMAYEFIRDGGTSGNIIGVTEINGTGDYTKRLTIPSGYTGAYSIRAFVFSGVCSQIGTGNSYKITRTVISSDKSAKVEGDVPIPPKTVTADHLGDGNILVSWDWSWPQATGAEIAWSDYDRIMESNETPNTMDVPMNTVTSRIIRNLELGRTWYFWVRLKKDENISFWSNPISITPYSSPDTPYLELSRDWITLNDKFIARWTYVTTDNTEQKSVSIRKGIISDDIFVPIGEPVEIEGVMQSAELDPNTWGMLTGTDYYFQCRVTSENGLQSANWSDPQKITVVEPLSCEITQTSLTFGYSAVETPSVYNISEYYELINNTYVLTQDYATVPNPPVSENLETYYERSGESAPYKYIPTPDTDIVTGKTYYQAAFVSGKTYYERDSEPTLTQFPLTVTVAGAGTSNWTNLMIVRAENYFLERPDESQRGGFLGEIVYQFSQQGSAQITIDYEDRISNNVYFDDEASYYLIAQVSDNYGQVVTNAGGYAGTKNSGGVYYPSSEDDLGMRFKIGWNHQATIPSASIRMDEERIAAIITLNIPETTQTWSYVEGDVYDIYRKSSDGYTLIYSGAIPGDVYVDPFPTIGNYGGYRIVYRTLYGDSITEDKVPAWLDFDAEDGYAVNLRYNIIDFGTARAELMFNADFDNSWDKDFKETKYLGGSIQGDWIAGVSKSGTINTNVLSNDEASVEAVHKLARYSGPCHVRTTSGSNYMANVNVSENMSHDRYYDPNGDFTKLISYSLSITRIDAEGKEAITEEEWNEMNNVSS